LPAPGNSAPCGRTRRRFGGSATRAHAHTQQGENQQVFLFVSLRFKNEAAGGHQAVKFQELTYPHRSSTLAPRQPYSPRLVRFGGAQTQGPSFRVKKQKHVRCFV
jgi:hypothetical protein